MILLRCDELEFMVNIQSWSLRGFIMIACTARH